MKVVSALFAVVLVAGLAAAAFLFSEQEQSPNTSPAPGAGVRFDQSAALEDRVRALEQAVAEERNARQLLEEELQILYAQLDALGEQPESGRTRADEAAVATQQVRNRYEGTRATRSDAADRVEALVDAGFASNRAEWIIRREAELQLEAMQARFDARRSGEPTDRLDPALNPDAALRAELGDLEYEQYLEANNRPTAVAVGSVLESSPGHVAGLQPGDQILSYDGQRVFNTFELNLQTMQGDPGESVVVDIMRDGAPMQIVLPRGPIGISARGGWGRR